MKRIAFVGADIFDGTTLHLGKSLVLHDGSFAAIIDASALPQDTPRTVLDGGTLMPGFVDLQVNGGGGVMFNDAPDVHGLARIAAAHATTGTRAILPTLITDTPDRTRAAVDAVQAAIAAHVPGILGIHLEGPHLSIARKGAHDPSLIRTMDARDEEFLCKAARRLPNVMVTVAPENVPPDQIARLRTAGITVSLGHSDCTFDQACAAFSAGAVCVTHLFNAMSQLGSREPGLVGATLCTPGVSAGLIADNIHVHSASIRAALAAKTGPGRVFLVTDAMSTVGSDVTEFTLNGRRVLRRDGRLTLEDGTLAGADLDMPRALSVLIDTAGINRETAFQMATSVPAGLLHDPLGHGTFTAGQKWNGIWLDRDGRYGDPQPELV